MPTRFKIRLVLFCLLALAAAPAWSQAGPSQVDTAFNRRDVGDPNLMPGLPENQNPLHISYWYNATFSTGRPFINGGALLGNGPGGYRVIVDSTGAELYNQPAGRSMEPFEQLRTGRVLCTDTSGSLHNISSTLKALLPNGEPDPNYDSIVFPNQHIYPLFTFADGRVLLRASQDQGDPDSSTILLTRRGGGLSTSFRPLASRLFPDISSGQVQVMPDGPNTLHVLASSQGRVPFIKYFVLDTLSSRAPVIYDILPPGANLAVDSGSLVAVYNGMAYIGFRVPNQHQFYIYRFDRTGQLDSHYSPILLKGKPDPASTGRGRVTIAFGDSILSYTLDNAQLVSAQRVRFELSGTLELRGNSVIYPSLDILATLSLGTQSRDLVHVLPNAELAPYPTNICGYGPLVRQVTRANRDYLFIDGAYKANGDRLPNPYCKVHRASGEVSPLRFDIQAHLLKAVGNDTYLLYDTNGAGFGVSRLLGTGFRDPVYAFQDSAFGTVHNVYPRPNGSYFAWMTAGGSTLVRGYSVQGFRENNYVYTIPADSLLGQFDHPYFTEGTHLKRNSIALYNTYPQQGAQRFFTRILHCDTGLLRYITLPTTKPCKSLIRLPDGGYAATCYDNFLPFGQQRETFMLDTNLNFDAHRTADIRPYVVLAVQSDGSLLVADDANSQILRRMPDGSEDSRWGSVSIDGPITTIYVGDSDRIYAYGAFNRIGGVGKNNLAHIGPPVPYTATRPGINGGQALKLFPNPASNTVMVNAPAGALGGVLSIYDASGALRKATAMHGPVTLDVHDWPAGLYQAVYSDAAGKRAAARLVRQ